MKNNLIWFIIVGVIIIFLFSSKSPLKNEQVCRSTEPVGYTNITLYSMMAWGNSNFAKTSSGVTFFPQDSRLAPQINYRKMATNYSNIIYNGTTFEFNLDYGIINTTKNYTCSQFVSVMLSKSTSNKLFMTYKSVPIYTMPVFEYWLNTRVPYELINNNIVYGACSQNNKYFVYMSANIINLSALTPAAKREIELKYVFGKTKLPISQYDSLPLQAMQRYITNYYTCGVRDKALVAHYSFDSNTNDDSGNSLNGQLINGATLTSTDKVVGNGALKVLGGGQAVKVLNNVKLQELTDNLTLSFWVKPYTYGNRPQIINKLYSGEFANTIERDGTISFYFGNTAIAGGYHTYQTSSKITNNTWQMVTIVRDMGKKLYLYYYNGTLISTFSFSSSPIVPTLSAKDMYIGTGYNWLNDMTSPAKSYNGLIDDVYLYNYVLTSSEVTALYNKRTATINLCGDNVKSGTEECDGTDLGGATCVSLGYTSGILSCDGSCLYNKVNCISGIPYSTFVGYKNSYIAGSMTLQQFITSANTWVTG